MLDMRVARGGDWGISPPPFHPKILQFARVFEKKTENPPPPLKFFHTKNLKIPPLKNFWLRR